MDTQSIRKQIRLQEQLVKEAGNTSSLLLINPTTVNPEDPKMIKAGEYFLPYSVGFEIECDKAPEYNEEDFKNIPNIIDVINDSYEQRYRIPAGIKGIVCLYNIAHQLQINSIKTESGIHYHIDCSDLAEKDLYKIDKIRNYEDLILNELDTWEYKGKYNTRQLGSGGSWVRLNNQFNTVEFRIGEMTFNYEILLRRIVHLSGLMRYIKYDLMKEHLKIENPILFYNEEPSISEILKNRSKKC